MASILMGRDADYIYRIFGDPYRYYYTGIVGNGNQVLIVLYQPDFIIIEFDANGALIGTSRMGMSTIPTRNNPGARPLAFSTGEDIALQRWSISNGFTQNPIAVKKFFLTDIGIGIVDFPQLFINIIDNPQLYSADELIVASREVERWRDEGLFELWLNPDTNLWLKRDGQVESS